MDSTPSGPTEPVAWPMSTGGPEGTMDKSHPEGQRRWSDSGTSRDLRPAVRVASASRSYDRTAWAECSGTPRRQTTKPSRPPQAAAQPNSRTAAGRQEGKPWLIRPRVDKTSRVGSEEGVDRHGRRGRRRIGRAGEPEKRGKEEKSGNT